MATFENRNNKQEPCAPRLSVNQIMSMKQRGMSNSQILQELKNQGYTSSQIHYAVQDFLRKQPYSYARQQQVPANKNHKKLFLAIMLIVIISVIMIAILPIFEKKISFEQEDIVFISQPDLEFQTKVKALTGYDWIDFLNADKSENAKIAALLFLANELDSLDDDFKFVNRSVGINKSEFPARLNATDNSKKNLMKLIKNVKAVENSFVDKGLPSAKIRANRILVIENFFKKNPLPEGEITFDASDLFAEKLGLTMNDYPRLVSLMIINYNLFLVE